MAGLGRNQNYLDLDILQYVEYVQPRMKLSLGFFSQEICRVLAASNCTSSSNAQRVFSISLALALISQTEGLRVIITKLF